MEGGRETRLGSPASRLRRRCRSEGLEHSPFDVRPHRELASMCRSSMDGAHRCHPLSHSPPRTQFVLNGAERTSVHIASFPPGAPNEFPITTALGEHYLAAQTGRNARYSPTRSKHRKESPTKPRWPSPLLPRLEELTEKCDADYGPKQPLKSILNNPRRSPPPGILKKKKPPEGRRRQRALSESEYSCGALDCQLGFFEGNGHRTPALPSTKRMRDNSGTVLGNATYASRPGHPRPPSPGHRAQLCPGEHRSRPCSPEHRRARSPGCGYPGSPGCCEARLHATTVLRTTAIGVNRQAVDVALSPPTAPPPPEPAPPSPPPRGRKPRARRPRPRRSAGRARRTDADRAAESASPPPMETDPQPDSEPMVDRTPVVRSPVVRSPVVRSPIVRVPDVRTPVERPPGDRTNGVRETAEQASLRQLSDKLTNGAFVSGGKREKAQRNHTLATLRTTNPFKSPTKKKDDPLPECLSGCVRPSLFPHVPPYLRFAAPDDPPLPVPPALSRHLKWKLTTITPIVVKRTLLNSGFKLVKSECDTAECPQEETVEWVGIWGKHMKSIMFRAIKDGQKMNHFPGTFQIGRKDRLWRNLQKLVARHGAKEFGIMPKTYVLPHDMKLLKRDWEKYAARNEKWIIKPPASARGTGIAVVSRWPEIPKKKSVVVQRYIARPYLINGSKFDLRLYVLLTSVHPLKIYLYNEGLARFASVKYTEEVSSLHDRYMHLTNYSINRLSKNYAANEDAAACQGHKWTLQTLLHYLKRERFVNTAALWAELEALVIKTIISGEGSIRSLTDANITSRYNCYELFGIDVLLDEELRPWLLEVNISPSLHSSSPLDLHVKAPLVANVLNMAQFHVPGRANFEGPNREKHTGKYAGVPYDPRLYTVYLSKEERDKHIIYTKMEDRDEYLSDILSTLTPDDVRHLVQAEDELTAMAAAEGMQRIFPTPATHKYLDFLPAPRYYNRLLDAWECKYSKEREHGIDLLRSLCDIGYHLEVPPVPLKNDVDAPPSLSGSSAGGPASLSLEVVAARAGGPPAPLRYGERALAVRA